METLIKVVAKEDPLKVLFECNIDETHKAYAFAKECEQMGIEVNVSQPTISQTLANALGIKGSAKDEYFASVSEEIEDHAGSCCPKDYSQTELK